MLLKLYTKMKKDLISIVTYKIKIYSKNNQYNYTK